MAEFQELLDFPPAPKLGWDGKLEPAKATPAEMHGQEVFFGKAMCGSCHQAPYYTDNTMHNLQADRFYSQKMVNGMMMASDGPIKTFPLRGIKDTPPYLHDGRLLTLDDTVEYSNLVLGTKLTDQEKKDLLAFCARCMFRGNVGASVALVRQRSHIGRWLCDRPPRRSRLPRGSVETVTHHVPEEDDEPRLAGITRLPKRQLK